MIVLICKNFINDRTGAIEYLVDYAVDDDLNNVNIQVGVHPTEIGATIN